MLRPMRRPNNNRLYEEVGGNFGNKRNSLDLVKQGILGNFPEARQAGWVIHLRDHLEDFRKDLNCSCALTYKALPSFQCFTIAILVLKKYDPCPT